jgi:hypothetical protein
MSMNKDQVKGRVDEAKGTIKEATGKLVGDKTLEAKGNQRRDSDSPLGGFASGPYLRDRPGGPLNGPHRHYPYGI